MSTGLTSPAVSPDAPMPETPAFWPAPSVIAQMANALFQAAPNQANTAPGVPIAPPSPAIAPAPSVTTSAAPFVPANPLVGAPDLPPTTIPSVVPTPNVSAPAAPTYPTTPFGASDVPLPGASLGSSQPGPAAPDAALGQVPLGLGDLISLIPPAHLGGPTEAAPDSAYFLSETPFAPTVAQLASAPRAHPVSIPADSAPHPLPAQQAPAPVSADEALPYFLDLRQPAQPKLPRTPGLSGVEGVDLRSVLSPSVTGAARPFDPHSVRKDFPILQEKVHGKRLIWLDNAATTQKPQAVIDRLSYFYEHENSNIHRAAHTLAARATDAYETARESVRRFLNAPSVKDIIFVRGATEGINLIAQSWGRQNIREGDEIVVTHLEHHANIVPWQMLCAETGARLRVAPVDDDGQIILQEFEKLLGPRTRLVSMTQVSNALGTVVPVQEMTAMARRHGAVVVVDGAQSVSHMPIDVQAIDCDFFVFSGHKVFAPTGIGAVYGRQAVLQHSQPWQGGGNMIADVTFEKTLYQAPPDRFEAGTGNIADAVGLGAAIEYVERIGMAAIAAYEHQLLVYATEKMLTVPGLKMIGTAKEKASVLSFILDGHKTGEVGRALDADGIAVRSGHHCAQPILRRFGLEATVRPSLAFYNTCEDVDALVMSLKRLQAGRRA